MPIRKIILLQHLIVFCYAPFSRICEFIPTCSLKKSLDTTQYCKKNLVHLLEKVKTTKIQKLQCSKYSQTCEPGLHLRESIQVYLSVSFEGYMRLAHVVITSWRTGVFIESAGSAFMKS